MKIKSSKWALVLPGVWTKDNKFHLYKDIHIFPQSTFLNLGCALNWWSLVMLPPSGIGNVLIVCPSACIKSNPVRPRRTVVCSSEESLRVKGEALWRNEATILLTVQKLILSEKHHGCGWLWVRTRSRQVKLQMWRSFRKT